MLATAVARLESLERLSMRGTRIGDESLARLLPLLSNGTFRQLDLKGNEIGDSGASQLAEQLATQTSLRVLDLQCNRLKCQGAIAIGAALQIACGLRSLNLRFNEIGDAGAAALGRALKSNSSITELHLGGNLIGSDGATQLASSLGQNHTLLSLDLRSNSIEDAGAVAVAHMCKRNRSLVELFLGTNGIGDDGCAALAEALNANSSLERVDLQGATAGQKSLLALSEALKVNRTLKHLSLDLAEEHAAPGGAAAVANALRSNTSLTELELGHVGSINQAAIAAINGTLRVNSFIKTVGGDLEADPKMEAAWPEPKAARESLGTAMMSTHALMFGMASPPPKTCQSRASPTSLQGRSPTGLQGRSPKGAPERAGSKIGRGAASVSSPRSSGHNGTATRATGGGTGAGGRTGSGSGSGSGSALARGEIAPALEGVHSRMEQLAAAMELRLQRQEAQLERIDGELRLERSRATQLTELVSEMSAKLQGAVTQGIALRELVNNLQQSDGVPPAVHTMINKHVEALQEQLRQQVAAEAEARSTKLTEVGEACAAKMATLRDELRWVDEECMRCRREDEEALSSQLFALEQKVLTAFEEQQHGRTAGRIAHGARATSSSADRSDLLSKTASRVDRLSESVGRLCEQLSAGGLHAPSSARVLATQEHMAVAQRQMAERLTSLEGAVRQEQESSLKALQSILDRSVPVTPASSAAAQLSNANDVDGIRGL